MLPDTTNSPFDKSNDTNDHHMTASRLDFFSPSQSKNKGTNVRYQRPSPAVGSVRKTPLVK